jgi:two-component system response regulator FixJ
VCSSDLLQAAQVQLLTPREREVLALARDGLDTQAIAEQLAVSPRTVEAHRSHIVRKFQVKTLAEVFRLAAK